VGFWPGLILGLLVFFLTGIALNSLYWLVRPFVWAALYGQSYSSPPGPYPPDSGEWLYIQGIWFISSWVAGSTVGRWSGSSGKKVMFTVLLLWVGLSVIGIPNWTASYWRLALSYLKVPVGFGLGNWFYVRRNARRSAITGIPTEKKGNGQGSRAI
jgi:hypothetical protein